MTSNIIELKHGELNVKLLLCSKSWRNTVMSLESDNIVGFTQISTVDAMYRYAYYSYVAYCRKNLKTPEFDAYEFDELLTAPNVALEESNFETVMQELSDSIISKMTAGVESEEKKT